MISPSVSDKYVIVMGKYDPGNTAMIAVYHECQKVIRL